MAEETNTGTETLPTSPVNADGSFADNWHDKFGEENKAHLSRYKSFDDLVNSHVATKSKLGKDPDSLVEIPGEHSSDKVKAAWRKAQGVPETIDGYEYTLSDELAVKLGPLKDKKMTAFREFANKQNWSPKQFKEALDFYHNDIAADIDVNEAAFNEQIAADAKESETVLRKQRGWQSEEEYKGKVDNAQFIMEKYGGVTAVEEFNLQNSPTLIKFLNNIYDVMDEDTLKGRDSSPGVTTANIKIRIDENREEMKRIMKENPVNYRNDPNFRDLDRSNTELYKQYPAKSK